MANGFREGSGGLDGVASPRSLERLIFEYSVLSAVAVGFVVTGYYCLVTGISPIPSSRISTNHILEIAPQEVIGDILELGAGWGTLAFPLAVLYPANRILAYELSPLPWLFMELRHFLFRHANLNILRRDFRKAPFETVGLVVAYLHSEGLANVRDKLERELKPGTLVLSNVFDIPGWTPEAKHVLADSFCPQVYLYRVPGS